MWWPGLEVEGGPSRTMLSQVYLFVFSFLKFQMQRNQLRNKISIMFSKSTRNFQIGLAGLDEPFACGKIDKS